MDAVQELAELRRLEELEAKAAAMNAVPAEPSLMDKAAGMIPNWAKNVGTAAYKGAGSVVTGALDAFAGSNDITDAVRASSGLEPRQLDTSMPATRALEATGYQPQTQGEKYVNMGVRGASGALVGPGSLVNAPRAAFTGAASGLGSEGAGQLPGIKGTVAEGPARVAGALAGGIGAATALAPMKNAAQLAGEMLVGIPKAEIEAAKVAMRQSVAAGVPINLDQAMAKDSNITNIVSALVGRKEGQPVVDQLRKQPELVKALAERLMNILPGKVKETAQVANDTQAAATEALKRARAMRTAATDPLFKQAGDVPVPLLDEMIEQAISGAKKNPDTNKGALFADVADLLKKAKARNTPPASGLVDAQGNPIQPLAQPVSMQELNAALRTKLTNAKNVNLSSSAGDREAIGGLQTLIGNFRDQMGRASPKFKEANDLYAQISANRVDPMKKSVIGRVAGVSGETADAEAVNKVLPILAKGRNPKAETSEITQFAKATSKNPRVFQDAVKTHFSNAAATAEKQVAGGLSPDIASAMEKSLLGNANQRAGMKDALEAIAVVQGKPKDAIYPGFMAAMKIISAAAKRPGAMGPNAEALNKIAGQSVAAAAGRTVGLAPGKPAANAWQNMLTADAYRALADNLTTAEGVAKLQALARVPIMSAKAQAIMDNLLAANAVAKGPELQNFNSGDNEGNN